jgi:hypothetical protein
MAGVAGRPAIDRMGRKEAPTPMSSWKWAAAAWAGAAVLQAVIAYGSFFFDDAAHAGIALAFAVSAFVSLLSAGVLALRPSASALLGATVWAGLSLVLGLWAMPTGARSLSVPFVVLLAGAGLLSYRAWQVRRHGA